MLDIFSGLRLVVKRRSINIDNAIFRCHWFFTSTLLVSFSLIITARQYVGQPIECHSVDKIPDSLLNSYCWVQSTFTVPQACNNQLHGIEVPYPCIDNTRGREVKVYAYYQWVGIVLFIQGLLFHLPYYLWKLWENGLIKAITGGLRVAVLNEQERAKKKEIVVDYIHDHLGCHKRYAFKYFLCEFICLINLMGQLWATNKFFDGQFLRYGIEVLHYSSTSFSNQFNFMQTISSTISNNNQQSPTSAHTNTLPEDRLKYNNNNNITTAAKHGYSHQYASYAHTQQIHQQVDPMTYIFPRMTKCTYFDFGSSGDVQKHDALCLLPLNIINEKIYIALWFWFLILTILTLLVIVYRLFAIVSENIRCKGLVSRCKLSSERDIQLICRHCDVGDWFLFYMVAENLDPLIMREIVAAIATKINEHIELKRELKAELAKQQELEDEKMRHIQMVSEQLCPVPVSEASSVSVQVPLTKKIKKRLYNKRLWSIDLGAAEVRQHLFGGGGGGADRRISQTSPNSAPYNGPVTAYNTSPSTSGTFQFATAPPASQMPLGAVSQAHQRRGSSSGVSTASSGSYVMEMSTLSGSTSRLNSSSARMRNPRHHHEA